MALEQDQLDLLNATTARLQRIRKPTNAARVDRLLAVIQRVEVAADAAEANALIQELDTLATEFGTRVGRRIAAVRGVAEDLRDDLAAAGGGGGQVAAQAAQSGGQIRRFALLIGANAYGIPGLDDLKGCANDIVDAAVTLTRTRLVAPGDIITVASPTMNTPIFGLAATENRDPTDAGWGPEVNDKTNAFAGVMLHGMHPVFVHWALHDMKSKMQQARDAGDVPMLFIFWSGHGGLINDELALKLPAADWLPAAQARAWGSLPPEVAALPDDELTRIAFTYHDLIDRLGLRTDESVFAVIGSCHSGAVHTGSVDASRRPSDIVFTAGSARATVRERFLNGHWRGLLNWAVLRTLEQYTIQNDGTLQAGLDLSFRELIKTVQLIVLALQDTSNAMPQVHGALGVDNALLDRRVGQIFTAAAGATSHFVTRTGGGIEWNPGTVGFTVYTTLNGGTFSGVVGDMYLSNASTTTTPNYPDGALVVDDGTDGLWAKLQAMSATLYLKPNTNLHSQSAPTGVISGKRRFIGEPFPLATISDLTAGTYYRLDGWNGSAYSTWGWVKTTSTKITWYLKTGKINASNYIIPLASGGHFRLTSVLNPTNTGNLRKAADEIVAD